MQRTLSVKTRFGLIVTALLAALGSAMVIVSPAAAATVERIRFVDEFAVAYTNTTSADGCINRFASVFVGNSTTAEAPVLYYDRETRNSCTGQSQSVHGSATPEVYDFSPHAVHAVATVPLLDGTEVSVDLAWRATGAVERNAQLSAT
jgi:hypothetical protein